MLALCLSGALAAPVSKSQHAVAAARSDFLVTEVLSAEPSDYASDYDPDMKAQKKQLKALRNENRIAAEKVAKVSPDGKAAASMLQRHSLEDEDDELLSPRMAERKADHDKQVKDHKKQMEDYKTQHEKQMHAKKKQHEKRKEDHEKHVAEKEAAEKEEAAQRKEENAEKKAEEKVTGKWVPDTASGDGKYHPKDEAWKKDRDAAKKDKKDEDKKDDPEKDPASLARFLAGLPGGATGPAARMATRTAERQKMKDQRTAEKEKMKTQKQDLKSSDKAKKTAEKTGVTVQPSPEPVASTETSAEWYAKATKKLKSTKSMDDNGVAKVKRTAKEHSELWKSKHAPKDDVAKVAKADDKKVHGGTAWPTEQEEEKGLEGLDAFDFNKAGAGGKHKSKSPSR